MTSTTASRQAPPPGDDSSGDRTASNSRKRKRVTKKKRKGGKASDDNNNNPNSASVSPRAGAEPKLACHYWRFDPIRYFICGSCSLGSYDAVILHLTRHHHLKAEYYCPKCFAFFDSETQRDNHLTRNEECQHIGGHDEITKADWNEAGSCPRNANCAVKWLWLWNSFFRRQPTPSPYVDDVVAETRKALIKSEAIMSVLLTRLPCRSPDEVAAIANDIEKALVRTAPDSGPFRVYMNDTMSAAAPQADVPANADPDPILQGGPSNPSQFLSPPDEPGGLSVFTSLPQQPLPPPNEPGANDPGDQDSMEKVFLTLPALKTTFEELWETLRRVRITNTGAIATWDEARECIDLVAWRQLWNLEGTWKRPSLILDVPILPDRIQQFNEMKSRVEVLVDPRLTDGDGGVLHLAQ